MYRCTDDKKLFMEFPQVNRFLHIFSRDWFIVSIHLSCWLDDNPEISQPQSPLPDCE